MQYQVLSLGGASFYLEEIQVCADHLSGLQTRYKQALSSTSLCRWKWFTEEKSCDEASSFNVYSSRRRFEKKSYKAQFQIQLIQVPQGFMKEVQEKEEKNLFVRRETEEERQRMEGCVTRWLTWPWN